jgi:mono/diheme cytochrome c family protein
MRSPGTFRFAAAGLLAAALAVLACPVAIADEPATPGAALTFEGSIRPILKAHCFQCHGEQGKKEGNLDLRLRRLMVAGGDSGPAIVPGRSGESYLLQRVRDGEMPPGKAAKKLSADEVSLIERWITTDAPTARPEPDETSGEFLITAEDRSHWAFQPIDRRKTPTPQNADRVRTPIDAFLLSKLEEHGASLAPDADRRTLVRRAYFDLIGLPPTREQLAEALTDPSVNWFEHLVDRLLESPHYGERWGRHWLDVAGYADSDGAVGDRERPHAYRYRDYVIRSFNADKPFDQFVREQLAGDEMAGPISGEPTPEQAELLIATGFLQMAPDGTTVAADRQAAHNQLVADTLTIVSTSLLGLTVGCARCHDHRFDPISQEDYYRLRAIFEPALHPANWQGNSRMVPYFTDEDRSNAENLNRQQEQAVVLRVLEQQLAKLSADQRAAAQSASDTPEAERTDQQKQLLIDAKLNVTADNIGDFDRTAAQELQRLRQLFAVRLKGSLETIKEAGGGVPRTFLLLRGNPLEPKQEVGPGELTILQGDSSTEIPRKDPSLASTGRRLAYAKHLTDGTHPLLARVIVNRVWMHHFGRGLCATPADFGLQGDQPSHLELLDWLASEFMTPADGSAGWSLKRLHRLIMTSTAYRQSSQRPETLQRSDPENRLLGGFTVRRLEAEIVRDAILAVSGKLNPKAFGTAVPVMKDPTGEIVVGTESMNAGIPLAVVPMFGEEFRRSVYVQSRRTMPLTFTQMFDAPAMEPNCEARSASTAAPQSLVLMNSPFMLRQSLSFAERLRRNAAGGLRGETPADGNKQIELAWQLAYSRPPSSEELADAAAFLEERTAWFRAHPPQAPDRAAVPGRSSMMMGPQALDLLAGEVSKSEPELLALALLCQMLMSSNEFLYVG